ncbi:stalk domain-containing protein [Tumebacillus permanentifrigoris]|uniref:Copper amine oxidase-like protein n=1 Tax=Tumebacillus permanentifrigoris TaxID=378543 RepID=A0A316D8L7_9BACL|nr:stalk domain-containing protein [Tumebacillus permanentifrigoris]PWK06989.1 copper amine oxidase-like protein [Tumebacillus permanentifrigoris]
MKRLGAIVLAALLLVPSVYPAHAHAAVDATPAITVKVDDQLQTFDQPPVVLNGRTMVPVRSLLETLGATVTWSDETQTVSVMRYTTKGLISVVLKVGYPEAAVNEVRVGLDQAPEIINGRTMVPLRFVSESMRAAVTWTEVTKTVEIYSLDYQLFLSSLRGHVDLVDKMISLGANPNYRNPIRGGTPLTAAALSGHSDVITLLLDNGANINAQDTPGYSALMMAVDDGDLELSTMLLGRGANPNLKSTAGITALQIARHHQNHGLIELLQNSGALE